MSEKKQIVQCVPNFSEGRDQSVVEKIADAFRNTPGVKLLDYSSDEDHNRCVITALGEAQAMKNAVVEAVGTAFELIDMTKHEGQHPRMGAADVVPFVPIKDITMEETVALAESVAEEIAETYGQPIFLYEKAAKNPSRENLAKVRKGQYEAMAEKIKDPEWKPDFGPTEMPPQTGVTAVGARMPLVAYNINLDSSDPEIADKIAKNVRHISGGLRYCKGMGVELKDRGIVQVSMNMTDYTKTALYRVFELVKIEAQRYGVNVVGSEIIGAVPMEALIDSAAYYLRLEDFTMEQVLETSLME